MIKTSTIRGLGRRVIVAASAAIASAAMAFAGIGAAAPAYAADAPASGADIELKAVEGAQLNGHDFFAYEIGRYFTWSTGPDGKVTDVSVRNVTGMGDHDSWIDGALTANSITSAPGDDSAATVSRQTDAMTLAKLADSLGSTVGLASRPVAGSLSGSGASGILHVTEPGLYLIVDTAGKPIIIGTKIDGKDLNDKQLGLAIIKATAESGDKDGNPDGALLSAELLNKDKSVHPTSQSWMAGEDGYVAMSVGVPSDKQAKGLSFPISLDGFDGTPIQASAIQVVDAAGNPITDVTPTVTGSGNSWTITIDDLPAKHPGARVKIFYPVRVGGITTGVIASDTMTMKIANNDGSTTSITSEHSKVTAFTGHIDLHKYDFGGTKALQGAGFKIALKDGGTTTWLKRSDDGTWAKASDKDSATEFKSDVNGKIRFDGLGDQYTYFIQETTAPSGYILPKEVSMSAATQSGKLSQLNDISSDALISLEGAEAGDLYIKVLNISSILQLPQTGMNHWDLLATIGTIVVVMIVGGIIIWRTRTTAKEEERRAAGGSERRRARR